MAQKMLRREARVNNGDVTMSLIRKSLDKVLPLFEDEIDQSQQDEIFSELIRRWSFSIGRNATLKGDGNHVDWLNAERKANWRYWARYADYMERHLPQKAVDALDVSTDEVLQQLEDPQRPGAWDRRGLVVGHVQSGKTGNYTGLICKAADAGYKIIIVLAGLHNNLRSQTQVRLDEGFLGFESLPNQEILSPVGVGLEDTDIAIRPNNGTNRTERGDFSTSVARGFGVTPEDRPWLFVVKKQKTVLTNLNNWIQTRVADHTDPATGRKIVTNLPLLVIDDECDHGSVDTQEQVFDENGRPDDEHNPTTINRLIRTLLHSFSRKAYVGYTATPFANIFIHNRSETPEYGPDLFPSAFITSLGAPSNYVGPGRLFRSAQGAASSSLLRPLSEKDPSEWLPIGHKNGYLPRWEGAEDVPPSLKEAVRSFVYACAVRKLRGQGSKHCSMLVHVTRFTSVQGEVKSQIEAYHRQLRDRFTRRIDIAEIEAEMRTEFEAVFRPSMASVRETFFDDGDERQVELMTDVSWGDVREVLPDVLADIVVREINGSAKDALDYEDSRNTGLKVIAVGGDKLARGLTLEGLCTSYFVRTTKMYDTLMQMGRWFGYRDGYLDVCRLYTSPEMIKWFGHIAEAAEELRQDFDAMAASGGTPRDFGLRVRSHSTLTVTSRTKMRHAKPMKISFSGDLLQTIVFDPKAVQANFTSGDRFLRGLGNGVDLNEQRWRAPGTNWSGRLWRQVSAEEVIDFLQGYSTHENSYRVRSDLLARFVRVMADGGELTEWTVALVGRSDGDPEAMKCIGGCRIGMLKRSHNNSEQNGPYSIGTLISSRDQAIDLTEAQWQAALELSQKAWRGDRESDDEKGPPKNPGGPAIRRILGEGDPVRGLRHERERGLLMLYLLDPKGSELDRSVLDPDQPILAWAASLPGSSSGRGLSDKDYMANTVEWEGFSDGLG
ncbi:Z1 domain-containing protein [Limimaricola variabilis]